MLWGALYLVVGLMAIIILDMLTGRVRKRIKDKSLDTQAIIINQVRTPIGMKASLVITLGALWVFWPAAIGSALIGLFHKEEHDKQGE